MSHQAATRHTTHTSTRGTHARHKEPAHVQGKGPLTHYAWLSLLRAYGVVLVLVFHFFPWLMPGGFIGVDVFFVFSGYLIASLLINEFRKNGKVDLISFYKRRFRRLFPALLAMLLVTLPLSFSLPEDFRAGIAQQVAAALSWTTNFYEIAGGQSYANALLPHLFVHTWTLSIEMQFYLVWGLVLTVVLPLCISTAPSGKRSITRSRKIAALLAIVLALASYITMQIMLVGAEDPSAAYYSTFSHAFPILIGSAAGALAGFGRSKLVASLERINHLVGIVIVVLSLGVITALAIFLPFENRMVYHAGLLLTSLLIAVVILVGRGAQETLHTYKEPRVLQYLADRSYSIYLFHWPLMIIVVEWASALFGKVQVGPNPAYIGAALVGLVLTFVVSHLSYKYVELPFGSKRKTAPAHQLPQTTSRRKTSQVAAPAARSLPAIVLVCLLGVVLAVPSTFALATAPTKTSIEKDYQEGLLELDRHHTESAHEVLTSMASSDGTNREPGLLVKPGTITVIGDSVTIYPAEGITALTGAHVDAEVSRAMVNGIGIVQSYQDSKMLGEFVVIALATNAHADSYESAVAICEMLEPGHRLIFVTAYGTPSMSDLSAALRTLPDTYSFVTIADWNTAIAGQEHLLAADGYHLGGQEAIDKYVNVVVNAIEEAKSKPTS